MFRSVRSHVFLDVTKSVAQTQLLSILTKRIKGKLPLLKRVTHFTTLDGPKASRDEVESKARLSPQSGSKTASPVDYGVLYKLNNEPLSSKKVKLLCGVFDLKPDEAENLLDVLSDHNNMSVATLHSKIQLLQSYNIPLTAIKNKFSVLKLDLLTLQGRLEELWIFDVDVSKDSERQLEKLTSDKAFHRSLRDKKKDYLTYRIGCSVEELDEMCEKFPEVLVVGLKKMKQNLDVLLVDDFVTPAVIRRSGIGLTMSTEKLSENLNFLKQLTRDEVKDEDDDSEPNEQDLIKLETKTKIVFTTMIMFKKERLVELRQYLETMHDILGNQCREEYLATRLDCDVTVVKEFLKKYPHVVALNIPKLKTNLDLLLHSKYIKQDDLIKYPNLLTFSAASIKKRIQQLDDIGFNYENKYVNTFRCVSDRHFKKVTLQFLLDKEILLEANCKNKKEYLKKRLGSTDMDMGSMTSMHPGLLNIRLPKLKYVLDFLLVDCAISAREIILKPRVLDRSLSTMKARKEQLDVLGHPLSVKICCASTAQFQRELAIYGGVNI